MTRRRRAGSSSNQTLKLLKGGGRATPKPDPLSGVLTTFVDFVTSDLLTDLTRFAPVDELIRAANAVGGGPRVEARARALERIRRTLAGSVDGESWAVAVRDLVEAFTLRHVLRPWLKSIRNSPQSRTEAVEGLVGWYTTIAKRVAEGQGLAHLWN